MTGSRDIEDMFVFPVGRVMNAWLKEDILDAYENLLQELLGDWLKEMRAENRKRRKNARNKK